MPVRPIIACLFTFAAFFLPSGVPTRLTIGVATLGAEPAGKRLTEFLDQWWEFDMQEDPWNATRVGDHRFNDRLARETVADQERRMQARRELLKRLEAIPRQELQREEQINYDICQRQLQDDIAEFRFRGHLMPITNRSGFHISFPELPRQVPLNNLRDYENYLAR
ncbi:MAG: hypothetical protein RIS70_4417, partial [Planctomycetota bacterium]